MLLTSCQNHERHRLCEIVRDCPVGFLKRFKMTRYLPAVGIARTRARGKRAKGWRLQQRPVAYEDLTGEPKF